MMSPLPVPPPQAGEGTLTIDFLAIRRSDRQLSPLPRSGGGPGRGRAMTQPLQDPALAALKAPTLDDIETLARAAFAGLPSRFTALCEGVVIRVEDFPDDETLDEMGAESEYDLLGLFPRRRTDAARASGGNGRPAQSDLALSATHHRFLGGWRGDPGRDRHPCARA